MRHLCVAFATLTMFSACSDGGAGPGSDGGAGPGSDAAPPPNVFAWKIVHSDFAGPCQGEQCNRSTVVTGGEIIADDHEDWVSTLSPEEHTRIQGLATSPELAAFLQRGRGPTECPPFTDYSALLEVRTITRQGSGQSAFQSSTTDAFACFNNANHPAGALVLDLENLRKKHRPAVMAGRASLCVSTNGPWPAGNHHDYSFFGEVTGVVESFDFAAAQLEGPITTRGICSVRDDIQARTIALRADGGQRWLVTLGAIGGPPDTAQLLPQVPALTGKTVHMTLHRGASQDDAQGVVITENGQLLFAMQNTDTKPLAAAYLPGLTVATGAPVLTDRSRCSARVHSALTFVGDTAVEVAPGTEATFTIAGSPYGARTIASHVLVGGPCNGKPPRPTSWIVWRR